MILFAVGAFVTIKKKSRNKWLSLATNAVLQAFFISTVLLIVFHKLSYGSILGYYTTIYLKMLYDKDICEDYLNYRTQTERLGPLSMAFEDREPVTELETAESGEQPAEEPAKEDVPEESSTEDAASSDPEETAQKTKETEQEPENA